METKKITLIFGIMLVSLAFVSAGITGAAVAVDAEYVTIFPGEEGEITVEVENNEGSQIDSVSVELILDNLPFTAVGSNVKETDDIDDDEDEDFKFKIRASNEVSTGDYTIPYKVTYKIGTDAFEKTGSFGLTVGAKTELDFSIETKDNIVGLQGTVSLKIINSGLGSIKFISVDVTPEGYELISSDKVYVGTIESDDDDFATFDVIFTKGNPTFIATVTYKDFANNDQEDTISIPVKVYTYEEALELGLVKKSNAGIYTGIIAALIVVWFIYRKIKKRRKNKKGR